jgi:hypothetical protein
MHDGTKVQASAGSDSFRREGRIREHLDETRKQVAAMGDPREDSTPRRRAARERAARERQERLEKALQELEKIRKTKAGEEARQEARASLTDPEAVFSSEAYGDAYARCLGAAHVSVDPQRRQVPCSATMIRNDPLAHLDCLAPCVREWFVRRVCLVGAESTGKTTLAVALAGHYQTVWMPEYGREFCDVKLANGTLEHWDSVEFEQIAREHARREDLLAREASRRRRARHDA